MAFLSFDGVKISFISSCVPKQRVSNLNYTDVYQESDVVKLIKSTGIEERRFADENTTASDLGFLAAEQILSRSEIDRDEIEMVLFLSQTPDYKIPITSSILQSRLKLKKSCGALDLNSGCSGFIYGLSTAFSYVKSLQSGKVLLIIGETLSKILNRRDKSTSMLFGDGATALLIEKAKEGETERSCFSLYTDGDGYQSILIPDGGYRNPVAEDSLKEEPCENDSIRNKLQLSMAGGEVFDFTNREIIPCIKETLEFFDVDISDIDYFLFHQSNKFIIDMFRRKLKLAAEKVPINIQKFGNTSGVSIPLIINSELSGLEKSRSIKLLATGYGAGLSWGCSIFNINSDAILPLLEA